MITFLPDYLRFIFSSPLLFFENMINPINRVNPISYLTNSGFFVNIIISFLPLQKAIGAGADVMHCAVREFCWNSRSGFRLLTVLLLFPLLWWSDITLSAPITAEQAQKMTQAWVTANPKPMNSQLGNQIDRIETFTDANGQPIYHVIYLKPSGFVIFPRMTRLSRSFVLPRRAASTLLLIILSAPL